MGINIEFKGLRYDDVVFNWDASLRYETQVSKRIMSWVAPLEVVLKFKVYGVSGGKSNPDSIGGVLCNEKGLS